MESTSSTNSSKKSINILWSGITGNTGTAARAVNRPAGIGMIIGITRASTLYPEAGFYRYGEGQRGHLKGTDIQEPFDVVVDFSHSKYFEEITHLARAANVPLVIGTSGLEEKQMAALRELAGEIPVFRGGNFRFKVKKFIDQIVEYAQELPEDAVVKVRETLPRGKRNLPSETSQAIRRRVADEADRHVEIDSSLSTADGTYVWEVDDAGLICSVRGYKELAYDVMVIARAMVGKPPLGAGKFYTIDNIWEDLNP